MTPKKKDKPVVLIVDDDDGYRRLARKALKDMNVVEADSLAEGIDKAKLHNPDAVILDARFPGRFITGVDAIPGFRSVVEDVEIVIVTNLPVSDDSKRAIRLGAFAYMPKGSSDELRAVILAALGLLPQTGDDPPSIH